MAVDSTGLRCAKVHGEGKIQHLRRKHTQSASRGTEGASEEMKTLSVDMEKDTHKSE